MSNEFFLGIDGGGTKTNLVCVDHNGNQVGEGLAGPTNLTSTSIGAASFNLREGVRQATEQLPPNGILKKVVMGLAGLDSQSEHDVAKALFTEILLPYSIGTFELYNDSIIAMENGATNENAIVLIAGTGANCRGRNAQGHTARAGGMDYLLSDQGSGYWIGRETLLAAIKSYDGRGPETSLLKHVCEHFQVSDCSTIKTAVYQPPLSKLDVSQLTTVCRIAAEEGDVVANEIFDRAHAELIAHIAAVIQNLHLENTSVDLVFAGSVLEIPFFQTKMRESVSSLWPQLNIVIPEKPPVWGAVKIALSTELDKLRPAGDI